MPLHLSLVTPIQSKGLFKQSVYLACCEAVTVAGHGPGDDLIIFKCGLLRGVRALVVCRLLVVYQLALSVHIKHELIFFSFNLQFHGCGRHVADAKRFPAHVYVTRPSFKNFSRPFGVAGVKAVADKCIASYFDPHTVSRREV